MTYKLYSAIIACALFAFPVSAQTNCAPTPAVYETLANDLDQKRLWSGVRPDGVVIELWVNDAGDWSVIGTRGALTCLFEVGSASDLENGDPA